MKPLSDHSEGRIISLPKEENKLSRRYLKLTSRWLPFVASQFQEWPGRPRCGHFFGGLLWYGQETAMTILALAAAASSSEFDPDLAGSSATDLRNMAIKGLRYLCFTHDTGPEDCVRPEDPFGRELLSNTKWGERGQGFFRESQCGRTIAYLALTAALLQDMLSEEERGMLATIANDYLERFGMMPPRSGVFSDTQTEENAWTALGLTASLCLQPEHPSSHEIWENTKLWMFRTSTRPCDALNSTIFADGKTVSELCGRRFTTLPDGTAENHGFVHPSYMAASLNLNSLGIMLLRVYGQAYPPHAFWHLKDTCGILKQWCDSTGFMHPVQGMDWPYFRIPQVSFVNASANVLLGDSDWANMEMKSLDLADDLSEKYGGRILPPEVVEHCGAPQDNPLLYERMGSFHALSYLLHRLSGTGQKPSDHEDMEQRLNGVHVYPHAGVILHRHPAGKTSMSWRNRIMVLPQTTDGSRLTCACKQSMLASLVVRDRGYSLNSEHIKVRDSHDRAAVLLEQKLYADSVERRAFFASLPDGRCVVFERMTALSKITVTRSEQGMLGIVNDGMFTDHSDRRGRRRVYWKGNSMEFEGYAGPDPNGDVTVNIASPWLNVDDRFGLVFTGTGRTLYRNRHYFETWRGIEDTVILNLHDRERNFGAYETITELACLWCPAQDHRSTSETDMEITHVNRDTVTARTGSFVLACNFGDKPGRIRLNASSSGKFSMLGAAAITHSEKGRLQAIIPSLEPVIFEC